jgi:hypothetical protein
MALVQICVSAEVHRAVLVNGLAERGGVYEADCSVPYMDHTLRISLKSGFVVKDPSH